MSYLNHVQQAHNKRKEDYNSLDTSQIKPHSVLPFQPPVHQPSSTSLAESTLDSKSTFTSKARTQYRTKKQKGSGEYASQKQLSVNNTTPAIVLERILGLTVTRPAGLAINPQRGLAAFTSGATAVLYHIQKQRQVSFIHISTGNNLVSDLAASLLRPSAAPIALRPITSLVFDTSGQYLALGETGHHPRVAVWDCDAQVILAELYGHKYGISSLCFSPDSSFIVSVGHQHDGFIYLWDWRLNQHLAGARIASKINSVSFDPLGKFFLTVGQNHAKFWMLDKILPQTKLASNRSGSGVKQGYHILEGCNAFLGDHVNSEFVEVSSWKAFSSALPGSDDSYVYAITKSGILCHFSTSRYLDKWVDVKMDYATSLDISARHIACGGANGCIRMFEPSTLRYISTLPGPHSHMTQVSNTCSASNLPLYPDIVSLRLISNHLEEDCLVVIYSDNSLVIWDVSEPQQSKKRRTMMFHSSCVWGVEPIPYKQFGDATFGSCSSDGTIRIWSMDDIDAPNSYHNISAEVLHILYADEHAYRQSVTRNDMGAVDSASLNDKQEKLGIRCLKFSPDGSQLAAGDRNGIIRVYEFPQIREIVSLQAHNAEVISLDFSPSGPNLPMMLASASRDRLIHLFDASSLSHDGPFDLVQTFNDHTSTITGLKFSHNGQRLVSCSADKSVIFRKLDPPNPDTAYDVPHYTCYSNVPIRSTVYDMAIERSNKATVIITQDRRLVFMNTETGKVTHTRKPTLDASSSDLPHSSASAFSSNISSTLFINKVAIDPSGLFLATASSDKCIRIFDFLTGACLGRAVGHGDLITSLTFIDGGRRVVSASSDGCIFVWYICEAIRHRMARGQLISPVSSPQHATTLISSTASSPVSFTTTHAGTEYFQSNISTPVSFNTTDTNAALSVLSLKSSGEYNLAFKDKLEHKFDGSAPSGVFAFEFDESDLPVWARSSKESMNEDLIASRSITDRVQISIKGPWANRLDGNAITLYTEMPVLEPIVAATDSFSLRRRYSIESRSSPIKESNQSTFYNSPSVKAGHISAQPSAALSLAESSPTSLTNPSVDPVNITADIALGNNDPEKDIDTKAISKNILVSVMSGVHIVSKPDNTISDFAESDQIDKDTTADVALHDELIKPSTFFERGLFKQELDNLTFEEYMSDKGRLGRSESRMSISSQFFLNHSSQCIGKPDHVRQISQGTSANSSPIAYTEPVTLQSVTSTANAAHTQWDVSKSPLIASQFTFSKPNASLELPQPELSDITGMTNDLRISDHEPEQLEKTSEVVFHASNASITKPCKTLAETPTLTGSTLLTSNTDDVILAEVSLFKRLADKFAEQLLNTSGTTSNSTLRSIQDAMQYVNSISTHAISAQAKPDITKDASIKAMLEAYSGILVDAVKSKLENV
ncbi:hypothetical protein BATDEDRAFT_35991 [Batrachochytrium dendrobatidis JAM81]|uniref:Uncharacterized protein n=1 Tax=Batrachochytrium dendrobatidis (strain JAM81 / FGSC 10211) TaxID=684364 RepID=F4PBA1_BATDJ|nr:uncharacterized protein BATDEDRAFT_35991 [Batrachochytrium dendrobatidis JAM81]EGF77290.1 hypothetical protein BATDEDRAFT_35991 [Batrachochytrium dendrobatidis JAM81]|eukprot:XP_006681979.1 hypothetical protein BATDEDRAFT_35991 [Batrachochytrium dendrobatidis JAM81]